MPSRDTFGRPIRDLRVSVTDRCNFRCRYCMPSDEYVWIEKAEILSFEEITRLVAILAELGVEKVRVTGGEPLVRKNLENLIRCLQPVRGLKDITLTTNGSLLGARAESLFAAGLRRINISIDTLRPDRFRQLTGRGDISLVLQGLEAARRVGIARIKINAVVIRGANDDEILDLVRFARERACEVRFIEYMDVGNASGWSLDRTVTKKEILEIVHRAYPVREVGRENGSAPAVDYEYEDGGGRLGIIGSVTEPFCSSCNRLRLTADGKLVTCLFSDTGFDLKRLLRSGASDRDITEYVSGIWASRMDRFSDERWRSIQAGTYDPQIHKKFEMIMLGG